MFLEKDLFVYGVCPHCGVPSFIEEVPFDEDEGGLSLDNLEKFYESKVLEVEEQECFASIHLDKAFLCEDCEDIAISHKNKTRWVEESSALFSGFQWKHGLSAYARTQTPEQVSERIRDIVSHSEWELCVVPAQQEGVGPFGLTLEGELTGLFEKDVWSLVDQTSGARYCECDEWEESSIDTLEDFQWCLKNGDAHYMEGWVKCQTIKNVWITEDFADRCPDVKEVLAKEAHLLGVPLVVC